jgi:hypothetical protein
MLEIRNIKIYGLEESAIRSGYPMRVDFPIDMHMELTELDLQYTNESKKHFDRLKKLGNVKSGNGHDNALSGIILQFDMKAPLYFMKQFQRYHFHQIISSESTMNRIQDMSIEKCCNKYTDPRIIQIIEEYQYDYKQNKNQESLMWLISNIPSSFELWVGISSNYLQEKTIYFQRRNHKLEDWQLYCDWLEELPLFMEIIGK